MKGQQATFDSWSNVVITQIPSILRFSMFWFKTNHSITEFNANLYNLHISRIVKPMVVPIFKAALKNQTGKEQHTSKLHPTVDRVPITGNEKNKNETITTKLSNKETKVEVLKFKSYKTDKMFLIQCLRYST